SRVARGVRRPPELAAAPVDRSLGDLAEEVYTGLSPGERALVPGLLLRLVFPGDGPEDTLRWVRVDDLLDGTVPVDAARRVLGCYVREDLVLHEGDGLTLRSAALVRAWGRMRAWMDAERERLRLHGRLSQAAALWRANGHDAADLYRGAALRTALEWAGRGDGHLTVNRLERSFLDASEAHARARDRLRHRLTAGVAALAAVAVASTSVLVA
uniref:nSTAND1 domain-containing NTPase n=1 Tax=Nonomuraea lactucae TaxID=2249762 RepID=UPI0019641A23